MSYSRWSNSTWYTYWCVSDATTREEEIFDICGECTFSYKELTENIDKCLESINESSRIKPTKEELDELKGYMLQFIEDVKNEYDSPSQRYKDGEIGLDEAFIGELG